MYLTVDRKFNSKTNLLAFTCFLVHIFLTIVYYKFNQSVLCIYCAVSVVFDFTMVALRKKIPNVIVNTLLVYSINLYALLFTLITEYPAGVEYFLISIIPSVFFMPQEQRRSRILYFLPLIPTVANILFIVIRYTINVETSTPLPVLFYKYHEVFCILVSLICLVYVFTRTDRELIEAEEKSFEYAENLKFTANHDYLTGLNNRRRLWDYLHIAQAQKEISGTNFLISIFDIDSFKKINDTYGHDAGDVILSEASKIILQMLPSEVNIGRWGGEEFVILVPYVNESAFTLIESIRRKIESSVFMYRTQEIKISMTFGVTTSIHHDTVEDMLVDADFCLMNGKSNGKNQVVISDKAR
jgi:diguanylate cyclase (GGDEF)-like protein